MNGANYRGERFHQRACIVRNGTRQSITLIGVEIHSLGERTARPGGSQKCDAITLRHGTAAAPAAIAAPNNRTRSDPVSRSELTHPIADVLHHPRHLVANDYGRLNSGQRMGAIYRNVDRAPEVFVQIRAAD